MLPDFISRLKSFAIARSMMAAIELSIFQRLADSPMQRSDLIAASGMADTAITQAFLDSLIAFELLAEDDGYLKLLPLGQSILPVYDSIQSWNQEMDLYYRSLDHLPQILKSGSYENTPLAQYWAYKASANRSEIAPAAVEAYSAVMAASQSQLSQAILQSYDFSPHQYLIDFGGGYAELAMSIAQQYPQLKLSVADLPAVCAGAQTRIQQAGLAERVSCLPMDFLKDDLPSDAADAILFSRVIHDWDDSNAVALLARTRSCLTENGTAIVVEPIVDDDAAPDPSSAQSNLMLTLLGGKRRSIRDVVCLLESSGYTDIHWKDCGLSLYKMVIAHG